MTSKEDIVKTQYQQIKNLYDTSEKSRKEMDKVRNAAWILLAITIFLMTTPHYTEIIMEKNGFTVPWPTVLHILLSAGGATLTILLYLMFRESRKNYKDDKAKLYKKLQDANNCKKAVDEVLSSHSNTCR